MIKRSWLPLFFCLLAFIFFSSPTKAWAAATLSFSPATKTVLVNDTFNVDVILNTGGSETDGADVIIRYDGNKLSLISAVLGDLYANKLTSDTSVAGKITLRATSSENASFNGTGTFATLTFKAIAGGTANLYFDFTSGATTDSNVAYQGNDILGSTSNASYTITTSGGNGGASASPSLPVSGTTTPTLLVVGSGLLMLILAGARLFFFKSL
jgi:hypothetical protein